MDGCNDFEGWTDVELRRAEAEVHRFLHKNRRDIGHTFLSKTCALESLIGRICSGGLDLDQRLNCFAAMAEIGRGIEADALGFLRLGSEPAVARLIETARQDR